MQIHIIAVGRVKESYLADGIAEYEKRLRPYVKIYTTDIINERRPPHITQTQQAQILKKEGSRILKAIPPLSYTIALDINGKKISTEALAVLLNKQEIGSINRISFIIGGDLGLSNDVVGQCNERLSLSTMTFTHQMVRLILLEQIYRAFRILRGEPYHK
jgi:23S rRNA (pseudouridine1915-N3)-methyltransferase